MILEFSFSNFGPVSNEVTLSFEATNDNTLDEYYVREMGDGKKILKLGVIYGPNASGKSTILEALELMRDLVVNPLDQKEENIHYRKHLLGDDFIERPSRLNLVFYINDVKHDYTITYSNEGILKEELIYYPNRRPAEVFTRTTEDNVSKLSFGSKISFAKKEEIILEGNTLKNTSVLGGYSKSNISNAVFDSIYGWFKKELLPMIRPNTRLLGWTSNSIEEENIIKSQVIDLLKKQI